MLGSGTITGPSNMQQIIGNHLKPLPPCDEAKTHGIGEAGD